MSKDYGPFAKFSLSYDFVFMALLLMATQEKCNCFCKRICRFNPLKKCTMLKEPSEFLEFTAAAAVIMTYYKILDDINDSPLLKSIAGRIICPVFSSARKKAAKKFPKLEEVISSGISHQSVVENADFKGVDSCADPTAKTLSAVFSMNFSDENTVRILQRIGYCLGKWIYLVDAYDDIFSDLKSGSFNPFIKKYDIKTPKDIDNCVKNDILETLNVCICEIAAAFELLDIHSFMPILKNIIYLGLEGVQNTACSMKGNGKKYENTL